MTQNKHKVQKLEEVLYKLFLEIFIVLILILVSASAGFASFVFSPETWIFKSVFFSCVVSAFVFATLISIPFWTITYLNNNITDMIGIKRRI